MSPVGLSPNIAFAGQPLPSTWQSALLEVRVERRLNLTGRVSLRFVDPGYTLVQSGLVSLGTVVAVDDPDHGQVALIEAEVTGVDVDQRPGEQPELVVVAHDRSHRMGRAAQARTFLQMSSSDVVSSIAGASGLSPAVDSSHPVFDYLLQVDSDLGLLNELARRSGFDWWVEGRTLHFGRPRRSPTVSLTLGSDLQSFSVRTSGQRPDTVVVDGWDRDAQDVVTGQASSPTEGLLPDSRLARLVAHPRDAFGEARFTTSAVGATSQAEADVLSQAILDRQAAAAVEATGMLAGDGRIQPGGAVTVSDAGPLNGTYPVTAVEHVYRPGRGFRTRFASGDHQPAGLVDALGGAGPASASVAPHTGLTVGHVTNINDPEHRGRVKVRFPGLSTEEESAWARIAVLGGGKDRGHVFIPEVNDEVLVAFEGSDTRTPVVVGGLYGSKSTIPTPDITDGLVQKRAITSRLGHTVALLDDASSTATQAIELVLAGGNSRLHLGKDKLDATVPAGTPVSVSAGSSSFKIADDGAITVQATSITIKADKQLQLQGLTVSVSAQAELSLQGQASAALKGAQVQVQGEGQTSISGGTVMIN